MSEIASWVVHTLGVFLFLWGGIFCKASMDRESDQNTVMEHLKYSGTIAGGVVSWLSLVLFLITR